MKISTKHLKLLIGSILKESISLKTDSEFKDGVTDTMAAVNMENSNVKTEWTPIDNGFYRISNEFAKKLSNGKLPGAAMERLVVAPKGFPSKSGFVWLAPTKFEQKIVWSIRDSIGWKLEGGLAVLSTKENNLSEESSTGGVGGYSTPFAFSKNKKGSTKGIEAAAKYGKIVGETPRV